MYCITNNEIHICNGGFSTENQLRVRLVEQTPSDHHLTTVIGDQTIILVKETEREKYEWRQNENPPISQNATSKQTDYIV